MEGKRRQLKQLTVAFTKAVVFETHKELSNVLTTKSAAYLTV